MTIGTNPLSYNGYIQQIAALAVYKCAETAGVYAFTNDAAAALIVPQMLNYAENRIQADMDLLTSQTSNDYTLTAGAAVLQLPIDDFFTVQTYQVGQLNGGTFIPLGSPLLPVSKEFIQNVYGGPQNAGIPQYFAMVGSNFGDGADSVNKILMGPAPSFGYTVRVTGTIKLPSLYKYASAGVADTSYTWISAYLPDMLLLASMIYISMYQRGFSATSDSPDMGQSYEKQYQARRIGGISEENRRKLQGSVWTAYSTPVSATPTR